MELWRKPKKEIIKNDITFLMLSEWNGKQNQPTKQTTTKLPQKTKNKKQTKKQNLYCLKLNNFAVCCQHITADIMIPVTLQHLRSDVGDIQSFCVCKMINSVAYRMKDASSHPNFKYTKKKSIMKFMWKWKIWALQNTFCYLFR